MLSSIFRDGVGIVGSSITSVNSFAFPSGFKRMPYSASIGLVEQLKCQSKEHLEELFLDSRGKSWEGLIIRRNTGYKAGRTGNYLKMKQDFDAEYTIVGCRTGPMRLFVNGKEQLLPVVLKSVDIIHKGQSVSVGSGFTAAERIRYGMNGGKDIIGRKITVKFAGETSPVSHCGRSSLRFPVVKILWDADGRDI
jgi:DNA ligase-1